MALTIDKIQKRADVVFVKFRNQKFSREEVLKARELLDMVLDDLKYFDAIETKKAAKFKNEESENHNQAEAQIKMIKALRMNNPLWDVE